MGKIKAIKEITPELLVALVHIRVFQVVLFLHMFQKVFYIRVLLITEAAVLLHLQMDTLYVDLHQQKQLRYSPTSTLTSSTMTKLILAMTILP